MRGPGFRHDLDVRRVWRCAKCGKQRRLPGDVTTVACVCGQPMELVEPRRRANYAPQSLVSHELTVESFALTADELQRPITARRPPTRPPRHAPDAPIPESEVRGPVASERAHEPPFPPQEDGFGAGLDQEETP